MRDQAMAEEDRSDGKLIRYPLRPMPLPEAVRRLLSRVAPSALLVLGDDGVLASRKLAVIGSSRCPGRLLLATHDLAKTWAEGNQTMIGGFHSAIEKECLRILLRGTCGIIVCPARSVKTMRIPAIWRGPLDIGRLLILSPSDWADRRATAELAQRRNELVVALADEVFVPHASVGGKIEQLCRKIITWGKPLLTLESPENAGLLALGAKPIQSEG